MNFGSNRTRRRQSLVGEINLTNVVDIVFNLFVFFLLSAAVSDRPAIDIRLPNAANGSKSSDNQDIDIALTSEGNIMVKNKLISLDELSKILDGIKDKTSSGVTLDADGEVRHKDVVRIMDLVREKGIQRISVATQEAGRS